MTFEELRREVLSEIGVDVNCRYAELYDLQEIFRHLFADVCIYEFLRGFLISKDWARLRERVSRSSSRTIRPIPASCNWVFPPILIEPSLWRRFLIEKQPIDRGRIWLNFLSGTVSTRRSPICTLL